MAGVMSAGMNGMTNSEAEVLLLRVIRGCSGVLDAADSLPCDMDVRVCFVYVNALADQQWMHEMCLQGQTGGAITGLSWRGRCS